MLSYSTARTWCRLALLLMSFDQQSAVADQRALALDSLGRQSACYDQLRVFPGSVGQRNPLHVKMSISFVS